MLPFHRVVLERLRACDTLLIGPSGVSLVPVVASLVAEICNPVPAKLVATTGQQTLSAFRGSPPAVVLKHKPLALIVDDDSGDRDQISRTLKDAGFDSVVDGGPLGVEERADAYRAGGVVAVDLRTLLFDAISSSLADNLVVLVFLRSERLLIGRDIERQRAGFTTSFLRSKIPDLRIVAVTSSPSSVGGRCNLLARELGLSSVFVLSPSESPLKADLDASPTFSRPHEVVYSAADKALSSALVSAFEETALSLSAYLKIDTLFSVGMSQREIGSVIYRECGKNTESGRAEAMLREMRNYRNLLLDFDELPPATLAGKIARLVKAEIDGYGGFSTIVESCDPIALALERVHSDGKLRIPPFWATLRLLLANEMDSAVVAVHSDATAKVLSEVVAEDLDTRGAINLALCAQLRTLCGRHASVLEEALSEAEGKTFFMGLPGFMEPPMSNLSIVTSLEHSSADLVIARDSGATRRFAALQGSLRAMQAASACQKHILAAGGEISPLNTVVEALHLLKQENKSCVPTRLVMLVCNEVVSEFERNRERMEAEALSRCVQAARDYVPPAAAVDAETLRYSFVPKLEKLSQAATGELTHCVVDTREFRSALPMALHEAGFTLLPEQLVSGDYILGQKVFIERKAPQDLLQSLAGGRVYRQCCVLSGSPLPVLLVEGVEGGAKKHSYRKRRRMVTSLASYFRDASLDVSLGGPLVGRLSALVFHVPRLMLLWAPTPRIAALTLTGLDEQFYRDYMSVATPETSSDVSLRSSLAIIPHLAGRLGSVCSEFDSLSDILAGDRVKLEKVCNERAANVIIDMMTYPFALVNEEE